MMKRIMITLLVLALLILGGASVDGQEYSEESVTSYQVEENAEQTEMLSDELESTSSETSQAVEDDLSEEAASDVEESSSDLEINLHPDIEEDEPPSEESTPVIQPYALVNISDAIIINHRIYDDTTTISGYVDTSLFTIEILNTIGLDLAKLLDLLMDYDITLSINGVAVQSVDIRKEGHFTFELAEPLPAHAQLTFSIPVLRAIVLIDMVEVIKLSDTVTIVESHRLEFNEVPSNITFETTAVEYQPGKTIFRDSPHDLSFSILNTGDKDWALSASIEHPLLSSDETHALNDVLFFHNGSDALVPIVSEGEVIATSADSYGDSVNPDLDILIWTREEGLLIQMNPFYARENTQYSTTIHWVLNNAPQ